MFKNLNQFKKNVKVGQKAKEMKFENNHISFLACERKTSFNNVAIMPSNEFKVGDTWLELIFEE